jgi:hypothetical protein
MNLNENINRIKQVMGLINEETEEDLRKLLQAKFPKADFGNEKFERLTDNTILGKGFSKIKNGNYVIQYNPSDDFFTVEYQDGTHQGLKLKRTVDGGVEYIKKSELITKYEEAIKKHPCLAQYNYDTLRQTSDGKVIAGYQWDTYFVHFNLIDSVYLIKGGKLDGEMGKFSCNGNKIEWGEVTQAGTKKKVSEKMVPDYFNNVTTSNPIVIGMRDKAYEAENGLIHLLQAKLKELSLYSGEPDGQFGPLTYQAVVAFQKTAKDADNKPLVPDGKVGPKTIQALGLKD